MSVDWLNLARQTILDVLDQEHAVTTRELEARISNQSWPTIGTQIDPDFVTRARNELHREGWLGFEQARTRGGSTVVTWHRTDTAGRRTAIARASARKRLLAARHESWARATKRYPIGLIGQAGEDALFNTLTESQLFTTIRHNPSEVLDVRTTSGPVDFTAYIVAEERALPTVHTALFEMKNQRQWFYRSDPQLHRFLHKAAEVQVEAPSVPIIPVMVVSRRHDWTWRLARTLGFYMVQYRAQYVLDTSEVDRDHFSEVFHELGYNDLRLGTEPNNNLRRAIHESLPRNMTATARRWAQVAPLTIDLHGQALRAPQSEIPDLVAAMEDAALQAAGEPPGYVPLPKDRL